MSMVSKGQLVLRAGDNGCQPGCNIKNGTPRQLRSGVLLRRWGHSPRRNAVASQGHLEVMLHWTKTYHNIWGLAFNFYTIWQQCCHRRDIEETAQMGPICGLTRSPSFLSGYRTGLTGLVEPMESWAIQGQGKSL